MFVFIWWMCMFEYIYSSMNVFLNMNKQYVYFPIKEEKLKKYIISA